VSKNDPNFRFSRDMLSPTPREDVYCTILHVDTRCQPSEVNDDNLLEAPATILEWLLIRREERSFFNGPAFCDSARKDIDSGVYEGLILEALHDHQHWEISQTSEDHKLLDGIDIDERYGIFRSFKRGAITRAQ
jgi:hypothetical protein